MNFLQIAGDSWRISWREWRLWVLTLGLFLALVPAVLLSGGLGFVAALAAMPFGDLFELLGLDITPLTGWLRGLPGWAAAGLAAAGVLTSVVTAVLAWILQAAAMRGTVMAVEQGSFSLAEALNLGRQRFTGLVQLSVVYGLIITILTLSPALLVMWVSDPAVLRLANLGSTTLAPVNLVLGLVAMLVMMAVALEDLRPKAAIGRAWDVFKTGWWLFLLVALISGAAGLLVVVGLLPLIFLIPVSLVLDAGWALVAPCAGLTLPLVLLLLTFTGVFNIVLYTLAYRSAAGAGLQRDEEGYPEAPYSGDL